MGFGMNLVDVLRAGANGMIYTAIGITLGIALGVWLGKRLGLARDTMYLVSVGTSICGGSAKFSVKASGDDLAYRWYAVGGSFGGMMSRLLRRRSLP